MQAFQGEHIYLRALEPEDLDFLYQVENDTAFWEVSSTVTPYSRFVLEQYLANAHLDIFEVKQLRLMIVEKSMDAPIGMIDLFDFNPQHKRAGVGIMISVNNQNKGFASEALELLINYSFRQLELHQLFANITPDNSNSLHLFKKFGFKQVGIKKEWLSINGTFKDEALYQLIRS